MTTPARIAAFLSTSALCLGLGTSAANAAAPSRNTTAPQASASAEGPQGERRMQPAAPAGREGDAPVR